MPEPESSQARGNVSKPHPLPLFRPEALAAPDKFYGDILQIRPFPKAMLGWVGAGVLGAVLSFLVLGRHVETQRTSGVVVAGATQEALSDSLLLEIPVAVSRPWLGELKPGRQVTLRCPSCGDSSAPIAMTILQAAPEPSQEAAREGNWRFRLDLAGSSRAIAAGAKLMRPGTKLELTLAVGEQSLLQWLLESRGS